MKALRKNTMRMKYTQRIDISDMDDEDELDDDEDELDDDGIKRTVRIRSMREVNRKPRKVWI